MGCKYILGLPRGCINSFHPALNSLCVLNSLQPSSLLLPPSSTPPPPSTPTELVASLSSRTAASLCLVAPRPPSSPPSLHNVPDPT